MKVLYGWIAGGALAVLALDSLLNNRTGSLAEAPYGPDAKVRTQVTWSNGKTEVLDGGPDIVPSQDLQEYVVEGVLRAAETQFGNQASEMFPASINIKHGDMFYIGKIAIDEEGLPILTMKDNGVKRPVIYSMIANSKQAIRKQHTDETLDYMRETRQPVKAGDKVHDFYAPIPKVNR